MLLCAVLLNSFGVLKFTIFFHYFCCVWPIDFIFYANFQYDEKALMEKTFPASKETFLMKIIWDIQAD